MAHAARLFALAGVPDAQRDAARVLALETALAGASLTRVAQRDPAATDHLVPLDSLRALAPHVDWAAYFRAVGLGSAPARVNVAVPAFVTRFDSLVAVAPLEDWRAYLHYHVLSATARMLSTPFVQEDFAFNARFTGAAALLPRWKRCLREADAEMGEALGERYVARTFPPRRGRAPGR